MTMDYISIALSIFFTLAAFGCFGMAAFFFYHNRHKQGIAFSTLMFVCVVVAYAPQLDSIKSGFVDAKFNRTLNQANDIIARLTSMAQINSKVAYTVLPLLWNSHRPFRAPRILPQGRPGYAFGGPPRC